MGVAAGVQQGGMPPSQHQQMLQQMQQQGLNPQAHSFVRQGSGAMNTVRPQQHPQQLMQQTQPHQQPVVSIALHISSLLVPSCVLLVSVDVVNVVDASC